MDLTDGEVAGLVRALVPAGQLEGAICVWDRRILEKGEAVRAGAKNVPMPFTGAAVFVDLAPRANWAHPCLYLLIDTETRKAEVIESGLPPFTGHLPPEYIVLLRYGRRPDDNRHYQPYD